MKLNLLILLSSSLLLFSISCTNNNKNRRLSHSAEYYSEDENNRLEDVVYENGTYCAEVEYYNPATGTSNTYNLDVEISDGELSKIYWANGGWLDDTHFYPIDIADGKCEFTTDRGYQYAVTLGEFGGCSYTDQYKMSRDLNDEVEATTCPKCGGEKDSYDTYCFSCVIKIEDEEENTCSGCGGYEFGIYGGLCSSCK